MRTYKSFQPAAVKTAFLRLQEVQRAKEKAVEEQDFDEAEKLRVQEGELRASLEQLRLGLRSEQDAEGLRVTEEDIAEIVSMWTGVPVAQMANEETERLLNMETALHERIVGQDEAISIVAKAVRRARTGLKDPKRPIGSFLFLGPTGVGKTELAKALSEYMFGSEEALLQLDMSEFMERHSVARLVGAPPGYVGYDDAGQLTEAVRRRPYCVVCFDEVEKAHNEALNILLQIMEDGHLSDARGRQVDFRNSIVIMTSNIGAEVIARGASIGFAVYRDETKAAEDSYQKMKDKLLEELKRTFRPEFLNRIDGIVVFHTLNQEQIEKIVDSDMADVASRLNNQHLELELTDAARKLLAEEGHSVEYGARPLRQVIQRRVEDPLCEGVLSGDFAPGDTIVVDTGDHEIQLRVKQPADGKEESSPVPLAEAH